MGRVELVEERVDANVRNGVLYIRIVVLIERNLRDVQGEECELFLFLFYQLSLLFVLVVVYHQFPLQVLIYYSLQSSTTRILQFTNQPSKELNRIGLLRYKKPLITLLLNGLY